jgi:DnaJ-domain-containing protein 1
MAELLKRLARLTQAHVSDFLERRWPGWRAEPPWQTDFEAPEEAEGEQRFTAPPFAARPGSGLPYSTALAEAYRALDLPFGAPMAQVTRQWKTYLKKCHPDRYANQPEKQADATRLTQELTRAHEQIKAAWKQHQP